MIEIIPAIDLIDGKCVRLTQGDYTQKKIYSEDPVEMARSFEEAGLRRLHLVDLDGARTGRITNAKVLERIMSRTRLQVDFGGGIKTAEDIRNILGAGAAMVAIGSMAVKEPELFCDWVREFGGARIFLGADVRNEKIAVSGWQEQTNVSVYDFIHINSLLGVKNIFCTDVSKDGLLQGPALELYGKILQRVPAVKLVASGGVSSLEDIRDLEHAGCNGVIIGKAIYEGRIKLEELSQC